MRALSIVAGVCFTFLSSTSWAGEATVRPDGGVTWQAGVDSVFIDFNEDGSSIRRVYSKYSTPVEFADRRGVAKAQVVAEEKAKAQLIRWMQQNTASTRVVTEFQSDLNKATQERKSGTPAVIRKTDERTLVEALTEVTASFSSGTLRGLIVLERGYDEKAEEAWVVVGYSEKTIKAARAAQKMISNPEKPNNRTESDGLKRQPSEVRKSGQKDW